MSASIKPRMNRDVGLYIQRLLFFYILLKRKMAISLNFVIDEIL
jgi:hypothetical protein